MLAYEPEEKPLDTSFDEAGISPKEILCRETFSFPAKDQKGFNLEQAKALMLLSALTYQAPRDIRKIARKWGFQHIDIHEKGNSRAVLFGKDNYLIVAFRGSVNWIDIANSANFFSTENSTILGEKVHGGFYKYLHAKQKEDEKTLWEEIDAAGAKYAREHHDPDVYMTGHSLGGSLALLGAAQLLEQYKDSKLKGVYCFGHCRVGGESFIRKIEERLDDRYYRVRNNGDWLAEEMFFSGFIHSEKNVELNPDGHVKLNGETIVSPIICPIKTKSEKPLIIDKVLTAAVGFINTHPFYHDQLSYLRNIDFAIATQQGEIPKNLLTEIQAQSHVCLNKNTWPSKFTF